MTPLQWERCHGVQRCVPIQQFVTLAKDEESQQLQGGNHNVADSRC